MSVNNQEAVLLMEDNGEERGRTPSQKRAAEESPTSIDEVTMTHIRRTIKRNKARRSVSLSNSEDRYTQTEVPTKQTLEKSLKIPKTLSVARPNIEDIYTGAPTTLMLEEIFKTPKITCKARTTDKVAKPVETANRFDKLRSLDKGEHTPKKPDPPKTTQEKEKKAPKNKPIEVYLNPTHGDPNLSKGIRDLERDLRTTGNGYVPSITRVNQKTYKVFPKDDAHKTQILQVLKAHGYKFSSPQERKDAPHKVVIRGLDLDKPLEDIKAEIAHTLDIEVLRVAQFTDWSKKARPENNNNAERPKLPLFVVSVPNTKQGKKIHALQQVGCLNVKVKPFRARKSTLQCHNCQRFGHIKYACHDDPACFRCAGPHPSSECDAVAGAESKCSNCTGPHPSTLRECPTRLEYEQKSRQTTAQENPNSKIESTEAHLNAQATQGSSKEDFPALKVTDSSREALEKTFNSKSNSSACAIKPTAINVQTATKNTETTVQKTVALGEEQCLVQDSSHQKVTNPFSENYQTQSVAGSQETAILSMLLGGGIMGILQRVQDVIAVWQGLAPIKEKLNATIALLSQLATLF